MNLYLHPVHVRLDRAEKPQIYFTPQLEELQVLSEEYPALQTVWQGLFGTTAASNKGGDSHNLSSNGIWSLDNPKEATSEIGRIYVMKEVDRVVSFIEAWKKAGSSEDQ